MRLSRLEIVSLPGISEPFILEDIGQGVNIISGPNAAGKSSVLRAIRYLVADPARSDPPVDLVAEFIDTEGHRWTTRRIGSEAEWRRDGVIVIKPRLPDTTQLRSYLISLENLLAAEESDKAFALEVARAFRGGYDLEALRALPEFSLGPQKGAKENKQTRQGLAELRTVERQYENLIHEEQSEELLEGRLDGERHQAELSGPTSEAIRLLHEERGLEAVQAALAGYPSGMEFLRGDESDRLDRIQNKRKIQQSRVDGWTLEIERHKAALTGAALPEPWPERADMDELLRRIQSAKLADAEAGRARETLTEVRAELATACRSLSPEADPPPPTGPLLDPETVSKGERLAEEVQRCHAALAQLESAGKLAGQVSDADIEPLRRAAAALRTWQAEQGRSRHDRPWRLYLAAVASVGSALAAVVLSAWLAAGLALVALLAVAADVLRRPKDSRVSRREDFDREGVDAPQSWDATGVAHRLRELEGEIARLSLQRREAERAQENRSRLAGLQEQLAELEKQRVGFVREHGLSADLSVLGLAHFVRLAAEYRKKSAEVEALEHKIGDWQDEVGSAVDIAAEALARCGVPAPPRTLTALESALQRLTRSLDEAQEARRRLGDAEGSLETARADLAGIDAELRDFWDGCGIPHGDERQLRDRLRLYGAWQKHVSEQRSLSDNIKSWRQPLQRHPDLLALIAERDEAELQLRLEAATAADSRREQVVGEIAQLRERLRAAGTDRKLEEAAANVEKWRGELAEIREAALLSASGQFLLQRVEHSHQEMNEPAIFTAARKEFERFTHHAFTLEADLAGGLLARDQGTGEVRSLDELSSATRMHLLLAVRVAWARHLEQGVEMLPLFLDEALTASDPWRFAEIATAFHQIVEEDGRQVFYLTARREDVALWRNSTGKAVCHLDIGELRGKAREELAGDIDDYRSLEKEPVPGPGAHTPEEYAQLLRVPLLDPWQPAESIHVFWILRDDLDELHGLLAQRRVGTLGQLQSHLDSAAGAALPPGRREDLAIRCRAAEAWIEAWRIGRGRPLTALDIAGAPIISGRFRAEITDLAHSLDGSAAALLEALRGKGVSGFGAGKIKKFEEWLSSERFLADEEAWGQQERVQAVLARWADSREVEQANYTVLWLESAAQRFYSNRE